VAYVPGLEHDLFVSYAHADDVAWVRALEEGLRERVRQRLGLDVSIWQDAKSLRFGQSWPDEIAHALTRTAALVAVLTPSYSTSVWCKRERDQFLEQFPAGQGLAVGSIHRLLKIIKTPWDNNEHLRFFESLQHIDFYRKSDRAAIELWPGTDEFRLRVAEAAESIAALLRAMRRQREKVYVASPAADSFEHWEALQAELRTQGFDAQPEGPRDSAFADQLMREEMRGAVLSVHLLGAEFDAFAAHQITLAAELGIPLLFWAAKEARTQADEPQQKLLAALAQGRGPDGAELPAGLQNLDGNPRSMIQEVLAALKPRPREEAPAAIGRPRVYLLCDPTSARDAAFARTLRSGIIEQEKAIDVDLPEDDAASATAARQRHGELLRACDGLLLYREAAPAEWFLNQLPSLLYGERLLRRPPMRSKAVLVDDPTQLAGQPETITVIPRTPNFSVHDLEPFLAPLRANPRPHAVA
jgi:TIR domain